MYMYFSTATLTHMYEYLISAFQRLLATLSMIKREHKFLSDRKSVEWFQKFTKNIKMQILHQHTIAVGT